MTQSAKQLAERATMGSFLNCYLRETGKGYMTNYLCLAGDVSYGLNDSKWQCEGACLCLPLVQMTLFVKVAYRSPTGRHRFGFPMVLQIGKGVPQPIDYITAIVLLIRELAKQDEEGRTRPAELIQRVIQSCENMESFIAVRQNDTASLYDMELDFLRNEQALIFGHPNHPTPKSRQGFIEWKQNNYAPELKGQFQLHYFSANRSLVQEESVLDCSAVDLVKRELLADPAISQEFMEQYCREMDDKALIPVHPHQAEWLLSQSCTQEWLKTGQLRYLGALGRGFSPTSSIRTVYHSEAEYMLKLSLQVKITNSMRLNKRKELIGGLEASRLLDYCIPEFRQLHPDFEFIHDLAYLTLLPQEGMQESGFELVIRKNPFRGEEACNVTLIAALVQDPLPDSRSRLSVIMEHLAAEEGRSVAQVSLDWFRRYMRLSLRPMIWLYLKYGIALEAHQQNCLIRLNNGYPSRFYYRDNQGYYYCRSMVSKLDQLLPGIGRESGNIYDDSIVEERFRYYLIVNHMFGMINGFGSEGLIDERLLLAELRSALESFLPMNRHSSCFLDSLLKDNGIPCKANLLTRLIDIDELNSELEQAVYVNIDNPLVKELPSMQIIHKAKQVTFLWRQDAKLIGSGQA